jgi:hypothetical protein
MQMVGAAVGLLVTLIVSVLIYWTMSGSLYPAAGTDTSWHSQMMNASQNATDSINDQAVTFFQIAPIIAIVIVAVVVLSYVSRIG